MFAPYVLMFSAIASWFNETYENNVGLFLFGKRGGGPEKNSEFEKGGNCKFP